MRKLIITTSIAISLSSCAGGYAGKDYAPVVDIQATAHAKRVPETEMRSAYEADLAYCQELASQRSVMTAGGQSGALASVIGAGIGALGGAVHGGGNVAEGALIGAAGAGLTGLAYGGVQGNEAKQNIVMNCLSERGYRVLSR